ncbi:MAG: hypothetical protein JNK15_08535, partial [Planctomycetes bacterium]|nr:hypothetical protein [Planctomycetota bacterium]
PPGRTPVVTKVFADDKRPQVIARIRAWLQTEMQRARFGRIRLPRELAGNDTSWLVSLRLDRTAMPQGHLDRAVWFVKARADRDESCELLHHRYWTEGA